MPRDVTEEPRGAPNETIGRLDAVTDTALARLSLDALLDELLARVRRILGADTAAILLVEGDSLVVRAAKGVEAEVERRVRIPIGRGFAARVAAEKRPIVLPDVEHVDVLNPILQEAGIRSLLGVPILFEGTAIGVLHVGSLERRVFTLADAQLLQVVADRIGLGIEYARLYQGERLGRAHAEADRTRTAFLASVTNLLSASLDYEATLRNLARLTVPDLGDLCVIDVMDEPTQPLRRVAVAHVEPARETVAWELDRRYPATAGDAHIPAEVARTGRPVLIAEVTAEMVEAAARDAAHLELLRQLRADSYMCVPLIARGRTLGAIGFVTSGSRRYASADLTLAQDVASRAALAIDNARIYGEAQQAEQRASFLAETSRLLAASLDYPTTLGNVARLAISRLADWCIVDVVEDGRIRRVAVVHQGTGADDMADELRRWPPPDPSARSPLTQVLSTGQCVFYPLVRPEQGKVRAGNELRIRFLRTVKPVSVMIAPLTARGRTFGAMTFLLTPESGRHYTPADLTLAEDLARRAALAVDNARLYREAQEAEHRIGRQAVRQEVLAEASRVFAEASLDIDTVLKAIVRHVGERIGDVCAIRLLSADERWLTPTALYHPDREMEARLNEIAAAVAEPAGEGLTAPVIESGHSILIPVVNQEGIEALLKPEYREYLRRFPVHSVLIVPLRVHGRVTGALALTRIRPDRPYDTEDQTLLQDLGDRAALAVETARLYRDAQEARAQAEAASRAKDEFLATVSHELRTPLTPILTWARLLEPGRLDAARTAQAVGAIQRSAKAQVQLIEDLLDVSRITTGKLRLNVQRVHLPSVIEAAVDSMRPAMEAKGIGLQTVIDPNGGAISGDPDRLQQVVWNLLSNAIKFTPKGGRVQVTLERVNSHVELSVRDNGKGFPAEFTPYLFERFRQADASPGRSVGGLGLGLAIVRHLIEMHGGTVRAESAGDGQGAVFTVKLPLLIISGDEDDAGERRHPTSGDAVPSDAPISLDGVRVLVVDDEPETCQALQAVLHGAHADVHIRLSAQEALAEIREWRPDVIVSDIGMPGADGYAFIGEVRSLAAEEGGRIPAVALTAYSRAEDRVRVLSAGFQMHVAKPVEPVELVTVIATLAAQSGRAAGAPR